MLKHHDTPSRTSRARRSAAQKSRRTPSGLYADAGKAIREFRERVAPELGGLDMIRVQLHVDDALGDGTTEIGRFTIAGTRGTIERVAARCAELQRESAAGSAGSRVAHASRKGGRA